MVMYGADVGELRRLGNEMRQAGRRLDELSSQLQRYVVGAGWDGPDGQQFLADWNRIQRPRLQHVAAGLDDVADRLYANALAQEHTSRTDSGQVGRIEIIIDQIIRGGGPLPGWMPRLPWILPPIGPPGGWLPWGPRPPWGDGLLPSLPWNPFDRKWYLPLAPLFPRLPDFPSFPIRPDFGRLIDFVVPEVGQLRGIWNEGLDGIDAALRGDAGSALQSIVNLGKSLPGGHFDIIDDAWTGFEAALRGDAETAIGSVFDLAENIPGANDVAGVLGTGWDGFNAALDGDVDTAVRSIVDLAWEGIGSRHPKVMLMKGAWDVGWEIGDKIYEGLDALGVNDVVQDHIINDTIQREFGGQVPHDFGKRYDGIKGFGNFVGDSIKSAWPF